MLPLLAVALYLHVSDALAVHIDFYGQTMRWRFANNNGKKTLQPSGFIH
jgi:hypothetical protein